MSRPRKYASDAARQAAFRQRHELAVLTVAIPRELADALDAYLQFKGVTKAAVICKLIETQLLRKR